MKNSIRFISIILVVSILCSILASCGVVLPQENGGEAKGGNGEIVTTQGLYDEGAEKTYTAPEIEDLVMSLDFGSDVTVESVTALHVSTEYLEELKYNSLELYIWEVAASAFGDLQGEAWFLSLEDGAPTPVVMNRSELIAQYEAMTTPVVPNNTLKNFMIGTGVILVCVALSFCGVPAISCIALSAAKSAVIGSIVGAGLYAGIGAISYRISEGTWRIPKEALLEYASMGVRDGAIFAAISGALNPGTCFPADTAVLSANGAVAIQNLKTGDKVWAWNEATGETKLQEVTHTFQKSADEIVTLTFENGEKIECTPEHPFYVKSQDLWVSAIELSLGDVLVNIKGEEVVLNSVAHRTPASPVDVYNLSVAEAHSFYVLSGEESVLVHNSCAHQTSAWAKERSAYWKSQAEVYKNSVNANKLSASGTYKLSQSNIARMSAGKAPVGIDGKYIQLHHTSGISSDLYKYIEVTSTQHFSNYKALHPWLFK